MKHKTYVYWLNAHQWDEMIDCFTGDALANIGRHGPHKGRNEITELIKVKITRVNENWNSGNFITEPIIFVEGNKATGSWIIYIFVFHGNKPNEPAYIWFQGRHDCEYMKINGKWKYKVHRTLAGTEQDL